MSSYFLKLMNSVQCRLVKFKNGEVCHLLFLIVKNTQKAKSQKCATWLFDNHLISWFSFYPFLLGKSLAACYTLFCSLMIHGSAQHFLNLLVTPTLTAHYAASNISV